MRAQGHPRARFRRAIEGRWVFHAECGRKPRDDENAAEEWRAYLDADDDLPVFCPECAEREFELGTGES